MKTLKLMLILALVAPLCTGCISRAIKEGAGAAFGAKGVALPVNPPSFAKNDTRFASYANVVVGDIKDDFGGKVPRTFFPLLRKKIDEAMREKGLKRASGKTIVVSGRIVHYEVDSALGYAFGNFEEVVARIILTDKSTGAQIAMASCIGRSQATTTMGVEHKAEGMAKAILKLLAYGGLEPREK